MASPIVFKNALKARTLKTNCTSSHITMGMQSDRADARTFQTSNSIAIIMFVAFASGLLGGCNPQYYKPNTAMVPLLQQADQIALTGGYTANNSYSAGAAYAFSDHIAGMGNWFLVPNHEGYSGTLFEAGLGYITKLPDERFVFETYGGVGIGVLYAKTTDSVKQLPLFDLVLTRMFIQPDFGFVHKYFESGAALRMCILNYTGINRHKAAQVPKYNQLDTLGNQAYVLLEPSLTLRVGLEFVKLQLQYVYSAKLGSAPLDYDNDNFSIGVFAKF